MTEYNLFADLLNKYSQLTPWVQTVVMFFICTVSITSLYFTKESIAIIAKSLRGNHQNTGGDNE